MKPTKDQIAKVLDLTHAFDNRGPRTYMARERLAVYLDTETGYRQADYYWLKSLIGKKTPVTTKAT